MKITGVTFTYDEDVKINKNFFATLANMDKTLNVWKQRKIQIIKTFGTSQLNFITNMTNTPLNLSKQANSSLHKILWNRPDKAS